jgi:tRNA 5-methylaminomethyl-2-thiouridine biosynthesis bifunctional protein
MSGEQAHWQAVPAATLEWQTPNLPRSPQFDDIYYSADSGLEESRHVFIAGNTLPQGWRNRGNFTIAETGFGTGLNFLATWQAWLADEERCQQLHYLALEKHPLRRVDMQRSLSAWPALGPLASQLLQHYPVALPGRHRLSFERGRILLDLVFDDAQLSLENMVTEPATRVDCWYLDGFAPARNPRMWQPPLYAAMAQLSRPRASFATFTAAGQVRRDLAEAGFTVEKAAGYGSKREMLRGSYTGPARDHDISSIASVTPWHLAPATDSDDQTAMVLGAGLAGATVAHALARRGWHVEVLEQDDIGAGASGMLQGVLYTRVSHRDSELNSYGLHSFAYASRFYRDMIAGGALQGGADGELCGALHLLPAPDEKHPLHNTLASMQDIVRHLDAGQAAQVTGLANCAPGLFYPDAGWMSPAAICSALLQHPAIRLSRHSAVRTLDYEGSSWVARDGAGRVLQRASVAVIAVGTHCRDFSQLQWLPTQSVRGQVSHIASTGPLADLRTVICHDGYISPARKGVHCIGATFHNNDRDAEPRAADHMENLQKLGAALPALEMTPATQELEGGRVGYRCTSPDYLPIVGPVPDYSAFIDDYAALRKNARRYLDARASYLPGLYLSTAHGSRGLTSAPLAAELVAAQISGQAWPVETRLCRALSPARFIVRDLIRNRI